MFVNELESRRLLAVSLDFNGVLSVTGDLNKLGHPKDDRIVMTQNGFDVVVIQNSETFGPYDASEILQVSVDGGGGNDKILSRDGSAHPIEIPEVLIGGSGNDTIEGGDNNDAVSGGSGNDLLGGGFGGDYISGGPGNDDLNGSTFAPTNLFDIGDTLDGGSGHDIADYSSRTDGVFVSNDGVADDGSYGANIFTGLPQSQEFDDVLPNCEELVGGSGNDALAGATGSNLIIGNDGDDALFGEVGDDTCIGGKGNDTLAGGSGDDSLEGDGGNDALLGDYRFIRSSDLSPVFDPFFQAGNDTIDGGDGNDIARGGGDVYFAASGDDDIIGGIGDDILFGDDGSDTINAGAGDDAISGGVGNDTMLGGNGDDLLLNNSFSFNTSDADFVDGGDGFDIAEGDVADSQPDPATIEFILDIDTPLSQPSGAPIEPDAMDFTTSSTTPKVVEIDGTSKNDAISITQIGSLISVSVNGTVTNYTASKVRRFVVECGKGNDTVVMQTSKGKNPCMVPAEVIGASGNDTMVGGSAADELYGGDGNDSLTGGAGDDQMFGDLGNDALNGGDGNDILNGGDVKIPRNDGADVLVGGPGDDRADYRSRTDDLVVTMNDGKANDGAAGEKDNIGSDVEDFFAGTGDDSITGNASANVLVGNDGNDTLEGLDGNDKLIPEAGDDEVSGDAGIDIYATQDNERDDINAPFNTAYSQVTDFISGDSMVDYSLVSKQFLDASQ